MDTNAPEKRSGRCPFGGDTAFTAATATLAHDETRSHPNEFYRAMRHHDPVYYDPELDMYLVSRYDDLEVVLRDPITFSCKEGYEAVYAQGFFDEFKEILERDGGGFFPDAIMSDPPYHTRVRRLMEKAFTAHRVKQLEPGITQVIVDLIEKVAPQGAMDGIDDFAVPLTVGVICAQLGLDDFGAKNIQRWSHAVTAQISKLQSREEMRKHAKDICELQNYLIKHIRRREEKPSEDMLSDLVHARVEGEDHAALNFKEVVSLARALLIAGNETTATAVGNLLFLLATRKDLAAQLRDAVDKDDDRLLTRFVEELLRIEPPTRGLTRMTTKEVELGGKLLPKGAHMLLLYASANDDETEFPNPREFDMTRGNLGRHVSFGGGVHRCIGLALARMEIKVAAREVAKRLENFQLTIPVEDVKYLPTVATRSIAHLPLTFSRRA